MAIKNRSQLKTQAGNEFPDNDEELIEEINSRRMVQDIADSTFNKVDDALLANLREYSETRGDYEAGEAMILGGSVYQANKLTSGAFNSDDWDIVSAGGASLTSIVESTGWIEGLEMSVNAGDSTKLDVALGKYQHVDNTTNAGTADKSIVNYSGTTLNNVPTLGTGRATYVSIDKDQNLVFSNECPKGALIRDNVLLGRVVTNDGVNISLVNNEPSPCYNVFAQLEDLMNAVGIININSKTVTPNNDLTMSFPETKIFVKGGGQVKDPHGATIPSQDPMSFSYSKVDDRILPQVTEVDLTQWDDNGTLTAIPNGNNASIQRIFLFPSGNKTIHYGQAFYGSLNNAVGDFIRDPFSGFEVDGAVMIGAIIGRVDTTDLSNTNRAVFVRASKFGEFTGGAGSSGDVDSTNIAGKASSLLAQNPTIAQNGYGLEWNEAYQVYDLVKKEVQSFQEAQDLPWYEQTFGTDIALYLSTSIKGSAWQEQRSTDVPLNKSAEDGDNVGMMYDASMNCLIADAESDLRRPTVQSDIDKNTFLDFVGGASGDRLKVRRSNTLLKPFHGTNPMGAIGFWVKMKPGTDGVRQVILNSGAETTANAGILLDRLNTNQLRIIVTYGSAGNSAVSFTSTATLTESDGWTPVRVELNGTGVGKGLVAIDGVQETFDVSAGADIDSTSDLIIASNLAGTTTYDIQIDDLIFLDRVFSAPEKATFESINYNRSEVEPTKYKMWDIDLRDSSTVWADTGKTTNAVNDDPIRVISSKHQSNYGGVIREMTSTNEATSPLYKSMDYYGLGGALWDGVDDNLDLNENLFEEKGGEWSFIAVIKNLDNLVGSNYMKGSLYGVVTGRDYPTNDIENGGRAYSVAHPVGSAVSLLDLPKQGDEFNIICYTRSGNTITAYNENLVKVSETTNEQWDINKFGEEFNPGFWFDGVLSRMIKIRGLLSDFEMSQRIKEIKKDAYLNSENANMISGTPDFISKFNATGDSVEDSRLSFQGIDSAYLVVYNQPAPVLGSYLTFGYRGGQDGSTNSFSKTHFYREDSAVNPPHHDGSTGKKTWGTTVENEKTVFRLTSNVLDSSVRSSGFEIDVEGNTVAQFRQITTSAPSEGNTPILSVKKEVDFLVQGKTANSAAIRTRQNSNRVIVGAVGSAFNETIGAPFNAYLTLIHSNNAIHDQRPHILIAGGYDTVNGISNGNIWKSSVDNRLYGREGNTTIPLLTGAVEDILDVDVSGRNVGDVLVWDGSDWVSQAPSGGGTDIFNVQMGAETNIVNLLVGGLLGYGANVQVAMLKGGATLAEMRCNFNGLTTSVTGDVSVKIYDVTNVSKNSPLSYGQVISGTLIGTATKSVDFGDGTARKVIENLSVNTTLANGSRELAFVVEGLTISGGTNISISLLFER